MWMRGPLRNDYPGTTIIDAAATLRCLQRHGR